MMRNADDILGRNHSNKRKFKDRKNAETVKVVGALPNLYGIMQSIQQKSYDEKSSLLHYVKAKEKSRDFTPDERQLIID